jgi:glycosyltransferase involved in cell wall biosynthesis
MSDTPDEMHDNATDQPLVTFAVVSFNQERFIEEAVAAALNQDYPNLEIIISDDCSTDRTFEYARSTVERIGGTRTIIFNQNDKNLGLISHINKINDLSNGKLIVVAAGDDISFHNRTSRIMEEWRSYPDCTSFHSSVIKINDNGVRAEEWKTAHADTARLKDFIKSNVVIGATQAWSPLLHNYFGPITVLDAREDRIIATRAALISEVRFIDEPLLYYRTSGISNSNYGAGEEDKDAIEARLRINELAQSISDGFKLDHLNPKKVTTIQTSALHALAGVFEQRFPLSSYALFRLTLTSILIYPKVIINRYLRPSIRTFLSRKILKRNKKAH